MQTMRIITAAVLIAGIGCKRADPLKEALVSGQWESVLKENGEDRSNAILGFLRAHTLFVENRNEEAICELVHQDPATLPRYRAFTQTLVERHKNSAVAQYLRGDALARSARWSESIESFRLSLALDANFVPALTARGVARILAGRLQAGKQDLYTASLLDPKFAEAQAAMGWTLLKEGQSALSALDYFARAAHLSRGYSLAVAGQGLAKLAAGDTESGADDLGSQFRPSGCAVGLLVSNSLLALSWIRNGGPDEAKDAPGTEIGVNFFAVTQAMMDLTMKRGLAGDPHALAATINMFDSGSKNSLLNSMLTKNFGAMDPGKQIDVFNNLRQQSNALNAASKLAGQMQLGLGLIDVGSSLTKTATWQAALAKVVVGGASKFGGFELQQLQNQLNGQQRTIQDIEEQLRPHMQVTMPNVTPRTTPGGATTSMTGSRLDKGNWPFEPVFGLLYSRS